MSACEWGGDARLTGVFFDPADPYPAPPQRWGDRGCSLQQRLSASAPRAPSRCWRARRACSRQAAAIINLGIGQPDFPTPPHIVEAAVKALRDGHHGYTPANGILALREAVAADMGPRRGVEVHPDRIVIVPGGKVTMFMAIAMFGEPGAEIMYPDPGFPIYRSLIEWTGATAVPMALHESRGFAFSAEEVLAQITPRTRLMIVNSPANPTGGVVPKAELDRLVAGLERLPRGRGHVGRDLRPHVLRRRAARLAHRLPRASRDRLILLDGWSKTYAMTGWRLGWGVWPEELVEHRDAARDQHPFLRQRRRPMGRDRGADRAAGEVGAHGRRRSTRRRSDHHRRAERHPGLPLRARPAAPSTPSPTSRAPGRGSRELQDELLIEAGVATISGTSFGIHGEGYLRFSYAASTEAIEEACTRIRRYLG